MTSVLHRYSWPWARLDEAIGHLAERLAGIAVSPGDRPSDLAPIAVGDEPAELPRVCAAHGLDCDAYPIYYGVVRQLVAPAIVRVPAAAADPAYLILAERRADEVVALDVDGDWRRLALLDLEAGLQAPADADARRAVQDLVTGAGVDPTRHEDVARALLSEQLADVQVADAWRLSVQPGTRIVALLRVEGVVRQLAQLLVMHAVQFVLWLAAWTLIGRGALDGRTDWGWMTAWALLIATLVPLQIWTGWTQGIVALGLGRVLKRRFLAGAVRLDADALHLDGAGRMLGRVLESGAVETMAVSGGLLAVLAVVELVVSAWALWYGAAGGWLVAWLLTCIVALALGALALLRRRGAWADAHLVMTHHLVERIAGHRTRLAQESPDRRHDDEDAELAAYTRRGLALDRLLPAIVVGLPRAWIVGGLLLVAPAFATGRPAHTLAIALGGLLLSAGALRRCGEGMSQLAGAAIAWREARALFDAAARPAHTPRDVGRGAGELPVVQLREVAYQYPGRTAPVLVDCTLDIATGDRVLLDGPSGGGKSTLAAIIAGLRTPTAGLVLAGGLDYATLGPHGWRKRVVSAPQFHENHVFCETFGFNLLMGRRWPATADEMADAETVARELGLGPLLERMPAGMVQMVGEGGWQLSHGERSRLFIARALLQGSDLVVLDESLAALDPETAQIVLDCVVARAKSLMVIAHE